MRVLNFALSLLVSLLIAALAFEGGLRLIGLGPPTTLNRFDARLGWSKKPGASLSTGTPDGGTVHFAFNEHGLREDDATGPAKPEGTKRMIALGDSFTLGRYVESEHLFLERLELLWQLEERDFEVINTGTEGWSTDQEVAWLLENGAAWQPDLVVLFPYENDVYWNAQRQYTGFDKPLFRADGSLETEALLDHMKQGFLARTATGRLFEKPTANPSFQPGTRPIPAEFGIVLDQLPEFMEDALARTGGALKALVAECERLGAELLVVPIPSETAIHEDERAKLAEQLGLADVGWSGDNSVDRILGAARAAGIPEQRLFDVRPAFRELAQAGERLYFERDWHLNPRGNEALAILLDRQLEQLGLLAPGPATEQLPAIPSPEGGLPHWLPWFLGLWILLGAAYTGVYRGEEKPLPAFLKVGALLAVIFSIVLGGTALIGNLDPAIGRIALVAMVVVILGFVAYKLGDRLGTIVELLGAFIGRGHWYLMPLVTVLLTVGSLLVVAASSPLVAPFIYTLF